MTLKLNALSGYRTYIIAGLIAIVSVAQYLKWIDSSTATALFGLLGAGGLTATRMAITKSK